MSISLKFPWTQASYVKAGQVAYKYQMAYSYKKYIGYAFIALMLFGLLTSTYDLLYLGLIFSVYWYYIRPILQAKRLQKEFKKEGLHGASISFLISAKGISINTNFIPWDQIRKVIIHQDGFLLERAEGYPFLPLEAFKNEEEVKTFLELVEREEILVKNII